VVQLTTRPASSSAGETRQPVARPSPARTLTLVATCLGVLLVQLDTMIVNLALRPIQAALGADVETLQWVVDAYTIVYASSILTGGICGDLYGRKRVYGLGLALFSLGSLLCGLAPNAAALVASRAFTGVGAALCHQLLDSDWCRRQPADRALTLTETDRQSLQHQLGLEL
jgi:MFS family permease